MNKLECLRKEIAHARLDGFLVPMADAYQSEYSPVESRRLEWLTGFTGSAGSAVVLKDEAAFFTDGRYTLQAAQQVNKRLFEIHDMETLMPHSWLAQHAQGLTIGYDPWLYTPDQLARFKGDYTLKAVDNLIDAVWDEVRTGSRKPAFIHEMKYSGEAHDKKIKNITFEMKNRDVDTLLLASPTAICWLLNIRADDLPNTPVLLCYAIVSADGSVQLFADLEKITPKVEKHLGRKVTLRATDEIVTAIKCLRGKVWADPAETPLALMEAIREPFLHENPCNLPKACKNVAEIAGAKAAHIRDGAALCRFFHWLEGAVGKEKLTEVTIADKLLQFRSEGENFHGASFDTIAGYGANGAIVHYRAMPENCAAIGKGMLLVDSGGQYLDGTTDVTRTIHLDKPTAEQKDRFTRVLKGHITLGKAVFPEGTRGSQLDVLARHALWEAGLDYAHGTGHGVGYFLNVHEGPQRISKRGGDAPLLPGMITSNEPGYYKEGAYGIRIENLVLTVPAKKQGFLGFENLTMVPIDRKLVEKKLLTESEIAWFNAYHVEVYKRVSPLLGKAEKQWLKAATARI